MGLGVKIRWFLLISIIIMGIAYKQLSLLLIPLLIYRETRDWIIDLLFSLIFPGLAPRLEVLDNYVYDHKNNIAHVFYRAEPLFDISRLSGSQYVNLVNEFARRLSLMPNEIFSFIRLGENKYIRLSKKVEPTEAGLSEFTNWVKAKETLLRQYFILSLVEKSELKRLVGFPRPPSTTRLVAFLALLDFAGFLLMGIYGLIALVVLNALAIKARSNYSVIKGGELGRLSHRLTASGLLFTKPSEEDLRSIAEAFVSSNSNFMLSVSGNPGFRGEVSRTVVSSHTKLIVHENPKAIPKASQWAVVLERINERGEEPVKAMLALDRQSTVPLLFTTRTTTQMHLWSMPSIDELGYDLAVIPIFHGGRVLSESLRARVYLGRDRENNELWIDFDSLPAGFGLIVAPTGMGKTKTMKLILLGLVGSGISVVVFDPHGEYKIPGIEPVDITQRFFNFFELNGVTEAERIHRLLLAFEMLGIPQEAILPDLRAVYKTGIYRDFHGAMGFIRARFDDDSPVGLVFDRLMQLLENAEIVPISELMNNKALQLSSVRSPDLRAFLMGVTVDHMYSFTMSRSIIERLQQLIVVDEAYDVLKTQLIEYMVREARKRGVAIIFITQTIRDIREEILKNMPFMIVLGGNAAYVEEVAEVLNLTDEDKRWLSTALPPHMAGLTAKAIVITEPIRRQAIIELEPAVKGLG
ncbi:helicase HerA domain-containing protein [Vulcanisaeta sp. EB80]|uniref:helicase HerA domain-containing protein n=1 Tax=Vulcanisaeta sp. EB80 TaxID=1650660 RepID=UPI001EE3E2BB|nr:DUF87 domain-containing protein [Vulcanisaeta sp. EB80]